MAKKEASISVIRLRVGLIFVLIFWIPIWLIAPAIANLIYSNPTPQQTSKITLSIALIQGVAALIGLLLVGRELIDTFKTTPNKKVLKVIISAVFKGEVKSK